MLTSGNWGSLRGIGAHFRELGLTLGNMSSLRGIGAHFRKSVSRACRSLGGFPRYCDLYCQSESGTPATYLVFVKIVVEPEVSASSFESHLFCYRLLTNRLSSRCIGFKLTHVLVLVRFIIGQICFEFRFAHQTLLK